MTYQQGRVHMSDRVFVLGARPRNIGAAVANELFLRGWKVRSDDCAVGDGSRPPGGNLPDAETARRHGYNETEKGHYQRYDAPAVRTFREFDADALVVSLGATYKSHFIDAKEWDLENVLKACLTLPLRCVKRYVEAVEQARSGQHGLNIQESERDPTRTRRIVLIGSYAHRHPFTNGTAYCAAKAGLDMAARTLGWELTDRGYRIHVVHPFHVQGTPMWAQVERDVMESKGMTYEEADAYNRKDLKMPDLLTADEVASVVATLLQVPAMDWLSGTAVELNGGSR
jgi:NAD(P)-dependent dehydrogenase (short-subunit alcohol dehydrogenase family)